MPQRPKGNVPSGYPPTGYPPTGYPPTGHPPTGYPPTGHPPTGHPNVSYPPSVNRYPEHYPSEDPRPGYSSAGFHYPAYPPQPYATRTPPQQYPFGPPPQQYPHGPPAPVHSSRRPVEHSSSDKHGKGTSEDLAGVETKHGRKQSTGATHRPTDSKRHSDRLAESEELTVATHRQTDSKRRSDKTVHRGKERKSTNMADTKVTHTKGPSPSTRISVRPGVSQSQPEVNIDLGKGKFDVKYESDEEVRSATWNRRGEKSTGGRSKVKATEPSGNNRSTGRGMTKGVKTARDNQNTERSTTSAVEPSRSSRSTQPTITEKPNYYAIVGCTINDTAETITSKVRQKQAELLSRRTKHMSKQEIEELDAKSDLVDDASEALEDEETRRQYDQTWRWIYGE